MHELRPLVAGQLDRGDRGDDLRGCLAGLGIVRCKGLEGELLNALLDLGVGLGEPFLL
jgi:hypothetical protein